MLTIFYIQILNLLILIISERMVLIAGVEYLDPELVVSLSPAAPQDMM